MHSMIQLYIAQTGTDTKQEVISVNMKQNA